MTTGSILLAIGILFLVALFVARPFLLPPPRSVRLSERAYLLAQKDALLAQIRVLDFDLETGKTTAVDHAAEREHLVANAAAILQELDALGTPDAEAEIEAAVQRLISQPDGNPCPNCGTPAAAADNFCVNCGEKLS